MNLIRQREDLKLGLKYNLLTKWQLEQALNCPVFLVQCAPRTMTDQEYEFLKQELMGGLEDGDAYFPKHPPYSIFRISYTNVKVYEQWFIDGDNALCFRCDYGFSMAGKTIHSLHHHTKKSKKVHFWAALEGVPVDASGNVWSVGNMKVELSQETISEFINSPLHWLAFFMLDVMTPKNIVLKVTPQAKGRSVEWIKAREHYLVIGRKLAVNLRERKSNPTDHELKRAAHWRIAHFRRLMSDKFKHKRGMLVPVKETWVGPDQWVGSDCKTYKVVDI